ncbi:hypothetical protein WICPIJ_008342 [Wickerhamomyces pijperi]|uniref:Putative transcription factor kapC n=1 Tax=Wickerhamomyces pijperi TaxID=599730 RepID=A0A9P8TIQ3_WICPI|nr:hypothetical protein WICPIJ_008342 [Wickerhamomyces pijperi]
MSANWTTNDDHKGLEDQIDPTFSRANVEANADMSEEAFEAAAAAVVAATNDVTAEQIVAQQQIQREQEEQAQQHLNAAAAAAAAAVAASASVSEVTPESEPKVDGLADKPLLNSEGQQISRNGRILSGTKRAEQNRQAQRAFRQRKDIYIKDLEKKVSKIEELQASIQSLKNENLELRNYSFTLQAKLIELHPDVPVPPLSLSNSRAGDVKE